MSTSGTLVKCSGDKSPSGPRASISHARPGRCISQAEVEHCIPAAVLHARMDSKRNGCRGCRARGAPDWAEGWQRDRWQNREGHCGGLDCRRSAASFEVRAGSGTGLLVPATALGLRQWVGLGVVVEIIGAAVEQQVGAIEAAVLPRGTVLRKEDGLSQRPMQQVVRTRETDDGRALLIAGGGIGIPRREILAVDLQRFAGAVQILVAQDGADGEVVLGVLRRRDRAGRLEPRVSSG